MRVRRTSGNQPHFSTAVLQLTGVLTESAAEKFRAQNARHVAAQPFAVFIADQGPVAVAIGGDDGVKCCSAHCRASRTSSGRMASVSTGMNLSERPSGVTSAPRPARIFTSTSRPTAEC